MFRLEGRDRVEADRRAAGQRVADREHAGVREPHDVAGERDVDRFASAAKSCIARVSRTSLPVRTLRTVMSRSNLPLQTRTNAMRSR